MASSSKLPQKRKQPDSNNILLKLSADERKLYELIESRKNVGIWTADMKRETGLPQTIVTKVLKSLQNKNLIKDVVNIHNKAKKIFMASKYEPSKEISGGLWYTPEGNLDILFINTLKDQCLRYVDRVKVATVETIWGFMKDLEVNEQKLFTVQPTTQQITEILDMLVLDKGLEVLKSSGTGDFARVAPGKVCYRRLKSQEDQTGALSSIPCGVCPRISECTPDGIISPITCVYFNKWLGIDF